MPINTEKFLCRDIRICKRLCPQTYHCGLEALPAVFWMISNLSKQFIKLLINHLWDQVQVMGYQLILKENIQQNFWDFPLCRKIAFIVRTAGENMKPWCFQQHFQSIKP